MITGIGTDLVYIPRMLKWIFDERLINRFFHSDEVSALNKKTKDGLSAAQSAAGRFAAKEAFVKAVGTGFRGISLKNICVLNNELGKPVMYLYGDALEQFGKTGARTIHLSITHEKEYALAFAVLEE